MVVPLSIVIVSLLGTKPLSSAVTRMKLRDGKADAGAPAQRAGRRVEAVGLAAKFVPAKARPLDQLREFLADDDVDRAVRLARAVADILVAGRNLHQPAQRERHRLLIRLGQKLTLAPRKKSPM